MQLCSTEGLVKRLMVSEAEERALAIRIIRHKIPRNDEH